MKLSINVGATDLGFYRHFVFRFFTYKEVVCVFGHQWIKKPIIGNDRIKCDNYNINSDSIPYTDLIKRIKSGSFHG